MMFCKLVNLRDISSTNGSDSRSWLRRLPSDMCNLPSKALGALGLSEASAPTSNVVLEVEGMSCLRFLRWSGNISSTFLDCVEICLDSSSAIERGSIHTVKITRLKAVPSASEVHVSPCTQYDWEILSNQAEAVESHILRQVNFPYSHEFMEYVG